MYKDCVIAYKVARIMNFTLLKGIEIRRNQDATPLENAIAERVNRTIKEEFQMIKHYHSNHLEMQRVNLNQDAT